MNGMQFATKHNAVESRFLTGRWNHISIHRTKIVSDKGMPTEKIQYIVAVWDELKQQAVQMPPLDNVDVARKAVSDWANAFYAAP